MKMHRFLAPILLVTASVSAQAQQVNLRGKVEDDRANPGGYFVDCTNTVLTSAGPDLAAFVGQHVALTGAWNGSSATPSVDVASIATVARLFEVGGSGKIGTDVSFKVISAPGDVALMLAALDFDFLRSRKSGVLFLSPASLFHVASGTVDATGEFEVKGTIPNDPSLEGIVVYGQSFVAFTAGGHALSNPDCVTIRS